MRILFQGDSITDGGRGRTDDPNHIMGHGYVFNIASYLGAKYPQKFEFINRGESGDYSTKLLSRWHRDTVALKPDVLSLMIGVNDSHQGIEPQRYEDVMNMMLDDIPATKLILMEPFRYRNQQDDETWAVIRGRIQEYQKIVRKIASERNAIFVPLEEVFDSAFQRAPKEYWIWDGVHPTYSGHLIISETWLKNVKPLLSPEE